MTWPDLHRIPNACPEFGGNGTRKEPLRRDFEVELGGFEPPNSWVREVRLELSAGGLVYDFVLLGSDDSVEQQSRGEDGPRRRATLKDVAEAAGVHSSTVSRVLRPETRALVNAETADRIDRVIEQTGYTPNRLAQGLKLRRSRNVGVLVNDITDPVFPFVVRGIQDRLLRDEYSALFVNTDGDIGRERRAFDGLRAQSVDGLILTTARREDPLVDQALDERIPLVLAVRNIDNRRAAAVTTDERLGARLAVDHLYELGHRQIGYIAGPRSMSTGAARLTGFIDAMRRRGLDPRPETTVQAEAFTIAEGERAMAELLAGKIAVTAVVAGSDHVAVGAISATTERGLRCPDDLSVVGVNDMPLMDRLSPPLTTLRVPYYELGEYAADLFLEQMDGNPKREITVIQQLIVRGSTAPPSQAVTPGR